MIRIEYAKASHWSKQRVSVAVLRCSSSSWLVGGLSIVEAPACQGRERPCARDFRRARIVDGVELSVFTGISRLCSEFSLVDMSAG